MNKGRLSFKSKSKNQKIKSKKQCVHDVNAKGFYYNNITITKQDHDNICLKLVLNKLKVICDFIFIYTRWAPSSKNLLKKLSIYM
jgi:hypothetical protein